MAGINEAVFRAIFDFGGSNFLLDGFALILSRYLGYAVIAGVFLLAWRVVDWRERAFRIFYILLSLIISRGIISELITFFYDSPRPESVMGIKPLVETFGNSFPAESILTLVTISVAIFMFRKKWGAIFIISSIIVGLAQIYSGAHWPLDVLGGVLIGGIIPFILWMFVKRHFIALFPRQAEVLSIDA